MAADVAASMESVHDVPADPSGDIAEGMLVTHDFVDCYQTHYRRLVRALGLSGADPATAQEYLRAWRRREWHGWLGEQVTGPFLAMVPESPDGPPIVLRVLRLCPSTAQDARLFGIYFEVEYPGEIGLVGATIVIPVDVTLPICLALAEYRAYRLLAGPPPGTVGLR